MRIAPSRWIRAFLFGILVEVATVLSIIATVMTYKYLKSGALTANEYSAFTQQAGATIGLTLGTIFVFVLAWPVVRSVSRHKMLHGLTVAAGAIALMLSGSVIGHGSLPRAYLLADILDDALQH